MHYVSSEKEMSLIIAPLSHEMKRVWKQLLRLH